MNMKAKKGFTLIELLIVIGILAVLATVTVLVLNPAELFRQARDSQRISDLGSIKGALSLYLTTFSSPNLQNGTDPFACNANFTSDKPNVVNPFAGGSPVGFGNAYTQISNTATSSVTGSGWVRVDFSAIQGGSPLSVLPTDPNKTDPALYYGYGCVQSGANALTFELDAKMESARYKHTPLGSDDVEGTDGGNQLDRYEVGTYPSLAF